MLGGRSGPRPGHIAGPGAGGDRFGLALPVPGASAHPLPSARHGTLAQAPGQRSPVSAGTPRARSSKKRAGYRPQFKSLGTWAISKPGISSPTLPIPTGLALCPALLARSFLPGPQIRRLAVAHLAHLDARSRQPSRAGHGLRLTLTLGSYAFDDPALTPLVTKGASPTCSLFRLGRRLFDALLSLPALLPSFRRPHLFFDDPPIFPISVGV